MKSHLQKAERVASGRQYVEKRPKYKPDPTHKITLEDKKAMRRGNR